MLLQPHHSITMTTICALPTSQDDNPILQVSMQSLRHLDHGLDRQIVEIIVIEILPIRRIFVQEVETMVDICQRPIHVKNVISHLYISFLIV